MWRLCWYIIVFTLSSITIFARPAQFLTTDDGTYRLIVPDSYDESNPAPLLIALHPTSSSPNAMAVFTGFDEYAEDMGMIVAYPQADGVIWNEGDPENGVERDDVAFINAVVAEIQSQYAIDETQITLTGFGSGGLMAYRIACESPEAFSAIAIVSALMWGYHAENCPESSSPVNMLILRGSEDFIYQADSYDYINLFDGKRRPILGVDDTLGFWSSRFTCETTPETSDVTQIYSDCDNDVRVAYYELTGARSNWLRDDSRYLLNQFGVDVSQIVLDFAIGDDRWNAIEPISSDTVARTYGLYVPSTYNASEPTPVVVVLHGRFGTGVGTAAYIGIQELAEQETFIGVYPDGLLNVGSELPRDTGWNYTLGVPFFPDINQTDDTQFITDLLDDLAQDLNIDRNRIYVTGISNGGLMVQRLACDVPDVFAGYASVAGAGFGGMDLICNHEIPVNMLIMHGTLDNNIKWTGNSQTLRNGSQLFLTLPIPDTMNYWAMKMGCLGEPIRDDVDIPDPEDPQDTGLIILWGTDCAQDAELVLYAIMNGGHNWPGIDGGIPAQVAGFINTDVDATQIIWDFFKSHSLEEFED